MKSSIFAHYTSAFLSAGFAHLLQTQQRQVIGYQIGICLKKLVIISDW